MDSMRCGLTLVRYRKFAAMSASMIALMRKNVKGDGIKMKQNGLFIAMQSCRKRRLFRRRYAKMLALIKIFA